MRRLLKHLIIAGTFAGGALSMPGCADNESGLFVQAVLKVEAPQCTVQPDASSVVLLGGVLDLAFRDNYVGALLVGNQLVRRGSRTQLRTETARIVLKGAEVSVLDSAQNEVAAFTVPGTGFVDPGTGEDPGYGVMSVELIPSGVAQSGQRMVVEVRVFGDTLGGDEITSASLTFPVSVCTGCLISYPAEADDAVQPGYQCVADAQGAPQDFPCRIGQDDPIDCRQCAELPICQSP